MNVFLRTLKEQLEKSGHPLTKPLPQMSIREHIPCTEGEKPESPKGKIANSGSQCFACHSGDEASVPFGFDPSDKNEWKRRLSAGAPEKKATLELLSKAIERLQDKEAPMPPRESDEGLRFSQKQRQELVTYLKSLTKTQ